MITLTNKTSIALLIALAYQNYGKAWYNVLDGEDLIIVGLHTPKGEVAYKIPGSYQPYLNRVMQMPDSDVQGVATEESSADTLLEWTTTL